jgi:hypothetical protein
MLDPSVYASTIYIPHLKKVVPILYVQGGPKKKLWCDLEEKCLRNSKIFFDGVFLSIYSYLKKLEISKLCRKKVMRL